ncbi:MAG: DUF4139 domain-containing protein [Myxococcales bacterium]|nr:DUF4139 domain-containing protein [Myxococcales bacterium]
MGAPVVGVVEAVTVFRRGATVRRAFALPAGVSTVALGPLPRSLEDGSVRVHEAGGVEVRELTVALGVFGADERLAPADSEALEAARLALAQAEARVATLMGTLGELAKVTMPARRRAKDAAPGPIPAAARLELASFRAERTEALRVALLEAETARAQAYDRLAVEEVRERRASSARQTRADELRKRVDLVLAAPAAEGARLVLEYAVPGASWAPSYALRFDAGMTGARLDRRAYVAQRSGEDWSGVRLVLSTAEPTRWCELPELPSLRIGRRQEVPARRGWRAPPTGADALFADHDAAFGGPGARQGVRVAPEPLEVAVPRGVALAEELFETGASFDDDEASPALGGAAPPMPRSAPMPPVASPMPPPPAAPAPMRSAGAPMPQAAAAPMRMEMARKKSRGMPPGFGGGGEQAKESLALDAAPEPEAPSGVAIDVELLAYMRLRLAAIDEPARGKLAPMGRVDALVEALEGRVVGDPRASLYEAERVATQLAPLPAGATLAAAVDGFDHAFEVGARADVPSDGQWHGVRVVEEELEAEARLVVVPRESDDVFRFAQLHLKGAPLLRGPADVFVGDRYLLARELGPTPTGGALRLGLGVEPAVRVARNVRFEERSAGLMGRSNELVHDVEVEVRSSLPRAAALEVRERVPTPREGDDDVEVREEEVTPAWEAWEPDASDAPQGRFDGGRRWRLRLEPSATRTLRARWVIRIAAKNELVGGNRREP